MASRKTKSTVQSKAPVVSEAPSSEGVVATETTSNEEEKVIHPTVDESEILAIVGGYHGAPHGVLGAHKIEGDQPAMVVRAFRPLDERVYLTNPVTGERTEMAKIHTGGFFELVFPGLSELFPYRLIVEDALGQPYELEDPYRFPFAVSDYDIHLFSEGNFYGCYEKFGAHFRTVDDVQGVNFAVWAPNAERVSVIGAFNGWDNRAHAMTLHGPSGIWEIFIPNLLEGTHYKYAIKSRFMGYEVDKADPYGFYAEVRPSTDSRVWNIDKYEWGDSEWMAARKERQALDAPLTIYEVHLGSWKRTPIDNGFLSYRDLAQQLVDYVKEMGYTHIELLPVTEHPYDGSWGYQVGGYYAPTSRFGSPDDFMYFIDTCHQNNIGVILDWVPAHFPRDAHGLGFFDGTHLYEHADPRQGEHKDWGTKIFNFGRNEVRNFLLGNALFWAEKYHMDGFRVDAVASMLYLDYSRNPGEWVPNKYGGRENLDAIDFLRTFNDLLHTRLEGVLTIAEESTAWPMVTRPPFLGGLGFNLKWNMGWMHDTLSYMQKDPIFRRYHQNQITFSLMYAFHENFVLPFSHDEVVHLKRSMLDKMPGDLWRKFANLRALYGYMYGHPGKKLLFMGADFGQWAEWSEARSLDWQLLDFDMHRKLHQYVAALNHLYTSEPALHEVDASWEGFQWIDLSDAEKSIISFVRRASDAADQVVVVCNLTPEPRPGYRVGLPVDGVYAEILNSDAEEFGGSGVRNRPRIEAEFLQWQNCPFSAPLDLPPLGVIMLKRLD